MWVVGQVRLEGGEVEFVLKHFLCELGDALLVALELTLEGLPLGELAETTV